MTVGTRSLFTLIALLGAVTTDNVHPDDFTHVWYYGCRWIGGISNGLICNCTENAQELVIQRNSITSNDISSIEINNCPGVRFTKGSISTLQNLRTITLRNDASVVLEADSFNWYGYRDTNVNQEERFDLSIPSLKIVIVDSHVDSIGTQAFSGRINEITLDNVQVDVVDAFAFTGLLQMENLILKNVTVKDVKPQAFKKFGTEFLSLDGVKIDYLPSRTFSDITVYRSFVIDASRFQTVRPSAFFIRNPTTFSVTNSYVDQLDGEAFWVITRGDVVFRNNTFNHVQSQAFNGITRNAEEMTSSRTVTFESNVFSSLERHALQLQPGLQARVLNLNLNQTCDCDYIVNNLSDLDFYHEIRCVDDDGVYSTVRDYKSSKCSILTGYYTTLIVVCVVILVIALLIVGCYTYYRLVYRSQKYGCGKGSKTPMSLIVPDGRTYRETEVHVVVERADLLTTDL